MCGLRRVNYTRFQFFFSGESSCVDGLGECFTSKKPALVLPCYGERAIGYAAEGELDLAIPLIMMQEMVDGLNDLFKMGVRYPLLPFGAELAPTPIASKSYPELYANTQAGRENI